jgi:ferredoxin like protein
MSLKYFTIEERLNANAWDVDVHRPHIKIVDPERCRKCEKKPCTFMCPARCYVRQGDYVVLSTEACVECGTCRVVCPHGNIDWNYPRSGMGIWYRFT